TWSVVLGSCSASRSSTSASTLLASVMCRSVTPYVAAMIACATACASALLHPPPFWLSSTVEPCSAALIISPRTAAPRRLPCHCDAAFGVSWISTTQVFAAALRTVVATMSALATGRNSPEHDVAAPLPHGPEISPSCKPRGSRNGVVTGGPCTETCDGFTPSNL